MFSGRPDPEWTINPSDPNYQEIQKLLSQAKRNGALQFPKQMATKLGYRGFLVSENDQESSSLIYGDKTKSLQKLLLETAPSIKESLKGNIMKAINKGQKKGQGRFLTKRVAPEYNARYWNGQRYTMRKNNCYNYANDQKTDTYAQPGRKGGRKFLHVTNQELIDASKRDGLVLLKPQPGPNDPIQSIQNVPERQSGDRHIVALVVEPSK